MQHKKGAHGHAKKPPIFIKMATPGDKECVGAFCDGMAMTPGNNVLDPKSLDSVQNTYDSENRDSNIFTDQTWAEGGFEQNDDWFGGGSGGGFGKFDTARSLRKTPLPHATSIEKLRVGGGHSGYIVKKVWGVNKHGKPIQIRRRVRVKNTADEIRKAKNSAVERANRLTSENRKYTVYGAISSKLSKIKNRNVHNPHGGIYREEVPYKNLNEQMKTERTIHNRTQYNRKNGAPEPAPSHGIYTVNLLPKKVKQMLKTGPRIILNLTQLYLPHVMKLGKDASQQLLLGDGR